MHSNEPNAQLQHIATLWSVVRAAHGSDSELGRSAREALWERYGGAAHRYLIGALHDVEAADDLCQEFALRFLSGGLKGADPQRGRFRDYLKGVLYHLIIDYQNRKRRQAMQLGSELPEPVETADAQAARDQAFLEAWRQELLARAWSRLEQEDRDRGRIYFAVLRYRAEHPDLSNPQRAEHLSAQLGRPLSADAEKQTLKRARDRFSDLLLDEIAQAIDSNTRDAIEAELIELGLYESDYCRAALDRYRA